MDAWHAALRQRSAVLACLALTTSASWAQLPAAPPSASPTRVALAEGLAQVGGDASSASFQIQVGTDANVDYVRTLSPQFELQGGVVAVRAPQAGGPPVPIAVLPEAGSKQGGQAFQVVALNALDAAGQPAAVLFGSSFAVGVSAQAPLVLSGTTPAGTSGVCNALGPVSVGLLHGGGSGVQQDAYTYTPSLQALDAAQAGEPLELLVRAGGAFLPLLGISPPFELVLPTPPFGCLELFPDSAVLSFGPASQQALLALQVPAAAIGATVDLQCLAVGLPTVEGESALLTNKIRLTIQ